MPARTTSVEETVSTNLSKIFDQAQNTTANHQKNVVALHKIQIDAAAFTESVHNGKSIKMTGERLPTGSSSLLAHIRDTSMSSDVEEDEQTAIDVLLDTLSCDPAASPERSTRAALLNIPIAQHTLDAILARTRDAAAPKAEARPSSGGNTTFDSIMDSEDEEEEEEVFSLVAAGED
ncbi:hypothetical protein BU15DRAFT_77936 [Melanogaster broomeanus]|nr:hypothetical protein BU15DRAFT_77936 [Melanogaster broomeanus]